MSDEPEIKVDIPKPGIHHGGKNVDSIVVSPNRRYAATWSEADKSIVGWSFIKGQSELQFEATASLREDFGDEFSLDELVTVSDFGHVAIRVKRNDKNPVNFEIINLATKRRLELKAPDIDEFPSYRWLYQKNGDFVLVLREPKYRAFVFSAKIYQSPMKRNLEKYKLTHMIELTSFTDCIITIDGKLLIINKRIIYTLAQWDLNSLSFEQQYILDWPLNTSTIGARFNHKKTLLAVFGRSPKDYSTKTFDDKVYVYSVERGVKMNMYTYKNNVIIDQAHFIASDVGERLLVIYRRGDSQESNYDIMDSWTLRDPVNAKPLFRVSNGSNSYFDFCTVKDDQIIGVHNGKPWIQDLVKDKWVSYLRETLHDYNEINTPSSGSIVEQMIKDAVGIYDYKLVDDDSSWVERTPLGKESFRGHLLRWDLDCGEDQVILEASKFDVTTEKWVSAGKPRNILPESHVERESRINFVVQCQLLYNDDFAILTPMGLFVWTVMPSGIRLIYFWGDTESEYQKTHVGVAKILHKIQMLKLSFTGNTLPPPDFDHILLCYEKFSMGKDRDITEPFRELLSDYIKTHELLALHGEFLLKRMIYNHKDNWIELICDECTQKYIDDSMQFGFLSIIVSSFPSLCQRHPSLVTKFMAKVALQIPHSEKSEIIDNLSTASHLHHYGRENQLYEASIVTRTFNNIKSASEKFSKKHPYFHTFFTFLFVPMWPILIYQFYQKAYNPDLYYQPTIKLLIPLPQYATYPKNTRGALDFFYPIKNPFVNQSTSNEVYHWWNGEALLNYKWNTFGKYYYYSIWFVYTLFLLCFAAVATIHEDQIDWSVASGLLIATIVLGCFHLLIEIRQFTITPKSYVTNLWNFFDVCAYLFPVVSSIIWLHNREIPTWVVTISILMLEVKFLLFFRAIRFFGVYFAIMIGVAVRVFSFLLILGLIVIAFAHSLHLLLRPAEPISMDVASFNDDPNNPWNLVSTMNSILDDGTVSEDAVLISMPSENTNLFVGWDTSLLAVYYMLNGDTGPYSSWNVKDNPVLILITVGFSFFTKLYLMSLFIGLLGRAIDERNNREAYLQQKAEIMYEIELVYLFPSQRRWKHWFPEIIYYEAHVDQVRKFVRRIQSGEMVVHEPPRLSSDLLRILELNEAESKSQEKERIREAEREKLDRMMETIEKLKALVPLPDEGSEKGKKT
ncbi:11897_t:CDS:2 [Acaulospora morrowiae]|uniref:11897_t:CDS:1 n=1 Tax=Acaulospora morrowiae TaxID=94023 RepID=A0A9N8V2N6_9GLOM|nr:11897_t:CDS:2 [Acaulospora morrowiae]